MRPMSVSSTVLLLTLCAAPAWAQAQPQELSQPTMQAASTGDTVGSSGAAGNKLICRSMFHNGSLIRTQTCRTQREWESIRYRNQGEVTGMQMRGLTSQPSGH